MLAWQSARSEARAIRAAVPVSKHGLGSLTEIANMLGAEVWVRNLDPDISGFVVKEPSKSPEIFINALDAPQRQRFTLAHEIGHLIDRMKLAEDDDYSFIDHRASKHYDLHEFYADEFAGELLMPADRFDEIIQEQGEYAAAAEFGVSLPAVRKRLSRLKKNPE